MKVLFFSKGLSGLNFKDPKDIEFLQQLQGITLSVNHIDLEKDICKDSYNKSEVERSPRFQGLLFAIISLCDNTKSDKVSRNEVLKTLAEDYSS